LALVDVRARVEAFVRASRAPNTLRAYRADWGHFTAWCASAGVASLPAAAETVASYLSVMADSGLKAGSVQRRVSAIAAMHRAAGHESPTGTTLVKLTISGIRRALGVRQVGKDPVLTINLAGMCSHLRPGLLGIRDRAILLVGFAGAFRRSELVDLDVEDLQFSADGVKVVIGHSKTDQEGAGQTIGIARGTALCPAAALTAWLQAASITTGPVFRAIKHGKVQSPRLRDRTVALIVKRYAGAAGLDPKKFAGHSLRAGCVTQAAMSGVPEFAIMRQTRHKSSDMLRRYIRDARLFADNASARLGL
jgi:site-specific recombinase XerD